MAGDQRASSTVEALQTWPLEGLEGKEVRLVTVEYDSGVHTPPHRHPGWQLIYVLDGPAVLTEPGQPVLVPEPA